MKRSVTRPYPNTSVAAAQTRTEVLIEFAAVAAGDDDDDMGDKGAEVEDVMRGAKISRPCRETIFVRIEKKRGFRIGTFDILF